MSFISKIRPRTLLEVIGSSGEGRFYCSSAGIDLALYRTQQTDTRKLTAEHLGKFFTVDPQIVTAFGDELTPTQHQRTINYLAPREWTARNRLFGETNILVREPALEIINCIQNSDFNKPALRYILYGKEGCGKSLTLAHLICYGYQENFVVLSFAWIKKWMTKYYEVAPSSYKSGRIDHIVNANIFLKNFKLANAARLENCVTHKEYIWSVRDKIQAGAPLMDVVELGCERLTFAADAMNVVIRELKLNCNEGNCKLMVVLDGVNSLFSEHTMIHREKRFYETGTYWPTSDWMKNVAGVDECSVLRSVKKLLVNDYKNAVVITSADRAAKIQKTEPANKWWRAKVMHMEPDTSSHLPFALLGQSGWSVLNPFIPVEVKPYTQLELDSTIDYLIEKKWIRAEAGSSVHRKELHFLSANNPRDLFNISTMF
ncbi:28S ribosomal protein S29, mitochondrial [Eurytemora carolleeae]|uniref:28S ribosomal protein S29, mitochondrial n=1 Tax=Eurytemora carolleeae TaxID=1294199 RepID=UPI000C761039|nr:28S ribosomal protein S29, mitochondrial [Eurytemora carolleeae]|eukprot:XP_023333775.1 28S ribosomal protein S29, mitochondrial-like [Eurytemora affinis]